MWYIFGTPGMYRVIFFFWGGGGQTVNSTTVLLYTSNTIPQKSFIT